MRWILVVPLILLMGAGVWFVTNQNETSSPVVREDAVPNLTPTPVEFTAKFEIHTLGTKRVFTQAMYHQQSSDVFIQNPDPSIVYVKKLSVTWADFFDTLPFSLTENCLVTGTKQTFCSNTDNTLRFFLNGSESPTALERKIQANDFLKVEYGP